MDFKKYLIVLIFFVVGVLVGKNMPQQDPDANSASSLRSGVVSQDTTSVVNTPTVTSPSRSPVTNTTTANNQVQQNDSSTVKPVNNTYPAVDDANIEPNTTTTQYAGIGFLTKNSYKGNVFNDVEEVKNLQKFLATQGFFAGTVDGKFGAITQEAVMKFQVVNQISPAAGYVGAFTRETVNQIIRDSFSNPSQPSGANLRPIKCTRIEGGNGPSSFTGYYNGSYSGNFNSLMIGDGWQSLYRCTSNW